MGKTAPTAGKAFSEFVHVNDDDVAKSKSNKERVEHAFHR
jgi:hypothetical protein